MTVGRAQGVLPRDYPAASQERSVPLGEKLRGIPATPPAHVAKTGTLRLGRICQSDPFRASRTRDRDPRGQSPSDSDGGCARARASAE